MRAWVSRHFCVCVAFSLACVLPVTLHAADAAEVGLKGETARVLQGDRVLSVLMLRSTVGTPVAVPTHHLLLVDTSASQAGRLREYTLAALEAYVAALPQTDRVALMAIDVRAVALNDGFVSPRSEQWRSALRALKRRVPLGAADLPAGVEAAVKRFADVAGRRAVAYFGDGMSIANLADPRRVATLADELAAGRIAFHAVLIGDRVDWELPAIFAHHSGGAVVFGSRSVAGPKEAGEQGRTLAYAARRPVLYLERVMFSPDTAAGSIRPMPLRADRDSVWLVEGDLSDAVTLTVRGSLEGEDVAASGRIEPDTRTPREHWSFLVPLAARMARLHGLNPLAGRAALGAYRNLYDVTVENMLAAARRSYFARDFAQAERLARTILEVAPTHAGARSLLEGVRRHTGETGSTTRSSSGDERGATGADSALPDAARIGRRGAAVRTVAQVVPKPPEPPATPGTAPGAPAVQPPNLIEEIETRRRIKGERLRLQVATDIEEARKLAVEDPEAALSLLKRSRGTVLAATDIDPTLRQELSRRLQGVIAEVQSRIEIRRQQQIQAQERRAVVEAERLLIEETLRDDERLENLIDQIRALIDEGIRGDDNAYKEARSVAEAAISIRPKSGTAAAAKFTADAADQLNVAFRLRTLRANRFLEALEQVERSHVPFPDEPPIRWPAPEVWKALSERRKKWASVDLHKVTKAEERINEELDNQTELEFADTPLRDAIQYIGDQHNIQIIIDRRALTEEGISEDDPVNLVLSGVTLRSALKIMLEPLGLTYVIEDEVMKITTEVAAEEKLSTRVYPVGDLVIPVTTPIGGGLGGFGGGLGGFGGGLGGFGGGLGGIGGGLGGIGGGLGGGILSIGPPKLPGPAVPGKPAAQGMQGADARRVDPARNAEDATGQRTLPVLRDGERTGEASSTERRPAFRIDGRSLGQKKTP